MVFRLALTGNIRKPSAVRIGFTKGTSFSTNSTTRTLPSGCREASKAVRGGNNSAEQIRPFLSATTFIMGLSQKRGPSQGRFFFAPLKTSAFSRPARSTDKRASAQQKGLEAGALLTDIV